MNVTQRKRIASAAHELRGIGADIQTISESLQQKLQNQPVGVQQSKVGASLEDQIGALDDAHNHASDAADILDKLLG